MNYPSPGELLSLDLDILNCANHVESGFWERVVGTSKDLLERPNGVLEGDKSALEPVKTWAT